jgi:hypothetical protein
LNGSENGNGEMDEEYTFNGGVLHMYDPQNDQLGLLDKIDIQQPHDELQTPYDDSEDLSSVSEYSVRVKEEDELIVDEEDEEEPLYDINGYDTEIYEGGDHKFFQHVEEEYGESTLEKSEVEDDTQIDEDETELLKENGIDPEIDPGSTMNVKKLGGDAAEEEDVDIESIDVGE